MFSIIRNIKNKLTRVLKQWMLTNEYKNKNINILEQKINYRHQNIILSIDMSINIYIHKSKYIFRNCVEGMYSKGCRLWIWLYWSVEQRAECYNARMHIGGRNIVALDSRLPPGINVRGTHGDDLGTTHIDNTFTCQ